jgi:hypothetical protein
MNPVEGEFSGLVEFEMGSLDKACVSERIVYSLVVPRRLHKYIRVLSESDHA